MATERRQTLPKEERLSWKRYIDQLFPKGQSFIAFPLRVVYLNVDAPTLPPVSILISVSKKRFKRAVWRNRIKRLIRESYRKQKYALIDPVNEKGTKLLVAFVYVDKEICSYQVMYRAMGKTIKQLKTRL